MRQERHNTEEDQPDPRGDLPDQDGIQGTTHLDGRREARNGGRLRDGQRRAHEAMESALQAGEPCRNAIESISRPGAVVQQPILS